MIRPLLLVLLSLTASARQDEELTPRRDVRETIAALGAWRAAHGDSWELVLDETTGAARFVYGGAALPDAPPVTADEAGMAELALRFVERTRELHGVDPETLELDGVVFLPLGIVGSGDKWTARYTQRIGAVPVRGASVNVLLDAGGRLLSVDTRRPVLEHESVLLIPERSAAEAELLAVERFLAEEGSAADAFTPAELVLEPVLASGRRTHVLAWTVEALGRAPGGRPLASRQVLAATGAPARLTREELVHSLDVSGTVFLRRSAGLKPDSYGMYSNGLVDSPAAHVRIVTDQGTFTTDGNGQFFVPFLAQLTDVEIFYDGPWCEVSNEDGDDYVYVKGSLSGTGNTLVMNSVFTSGENQTSQGNAFWAVNAMHDWIKSVVPNDPHPDFTVDAEVNWDYDTCNASYTGSSLDVSLEFLKSSSDPCANSAYSTVVWHEFGHWLNDEYDSGNPSNGFGEGCADVYAIYLADSPLVGEDFKGAGNAIRDASNAKMFCGDGNLGCYGEVHDDGEPLMGAAWWVRTFLKDQFGVWEGALTADVLFLAWLNAYDDDEIKTIIRTHWLVLDDDDGNIKNGTPHYEAIDSGFVQQGFPSYPGLLANVYVDAVLGGGVFELGSQQWPFDTVGEGAFFTQAGGLLHVKGASYDEAVEIDRPMTVVAEGGSVVIGL